MVRISQFYVEAVEKPLIEKMRGNDQKNECVKSAVVNDLG